MVVAFHHWVLGDFHGRFGLSDPCRPLNKVRLKLLHQVLHSLCSIEAASLKNIYRVKNSNIFINVGNKERQRVTGER